MSLFRISCEPVCFYSIFTKVILFLEHTILNNSFEMFCVDERAAGDFL